MIVYWQPHFQHNASDQCNSLRITLHWMCQLPTVYFLPNTIATDWLNSPQPNCICICFAVLANSVSVYWFLKGGLPPHHLWRTLSVNWLVVLFVHATTPSPLKNSPLALICFKWWFSFTPLSLRLSVKWWFSFTHLLKPPPHHLDWKTLPFSAYLLTGLVVSIYSTLFALICFKWWFSFTPLALRLSV